MTQRILCSISTRDRYFTTLPMTLIAVANQSRRVDKLVIFDDTDDALDLRTHPIYQKLFAMLDIKNIAWEWLFAQKKGQHFNHQLANTMGYDWVWRVDDDVIPDPNVLETLEAYCSPQVGAIAGSILMPGDILDTSLSTGKIEMIDQEPSIQWNWIKEPKEVEHLHCSFLYRSGIYDYNLALTRVCHREETLFSFGIHQRGYKLLVVPNAASYHLRYSSGGIRNDNMQELFDQDDIIFQNFLNFKKF